MLFNCTFSLFFQLWKKISNNFEDLLRPRNLFFLWMLIKVIFFFVSYSHVMVPSLTALMPENKLLSLCQQRAWIFIFDGAYFLKKTIDIVHLLPKFIIQSKPLFGQLLMYVMLMCVIFNKINVLFLTVVIPRNKLILMRLLVEDIVMSKTY